LLLDGSVVGVQALGEGHAEGWKLLVGWKRVDKEVYLPSPPGAAAFAPVFAVVFGDA